MILEIDLSRGGALLVSPPKRGGKNIKSYWRFLIETLLLKLEMKKNKEKKFLPAPVAFSPPQARTKRSSNETRKAHRADIFHSLCWEEALKTMKKKTRETRETQSRCAERWEKLTASHTSHNAARGFISCRMIYYEPENAVDSLHNANQIISLDVSLPAWDPSQAAASDLFKGLRAFLWPPSGIYLPRQLKWMIYMMSSHSRSESRPGMRARVA